MKYSETKLSFDDFLNILETNTDFDKDSAHVMSDLADAATETLDSGVEGYPVFYYYPDLGGKKYVLEENELNDCSIIYEINDVDDINEYPCHIILRDTVGNWDGDAYDNLALYRLSANPTPASHGDTNVKIWIEFYFYEMALNTQLDRYLRNIDVDVNSSNAYDAYDAHVFATYADADAWINEQDNIPYYLKNGEVDRPKYTIV